MWKLSKSINKYLTGLIGIFMVFMVIDVFLQVLFRFVIERPLSWTEEVSRYLFVWIVWIGSAIVLAEKAHVGIDILVKKFSSNWQRRMEVLIYLVFLFPLCIMLYQGVALAKLNMNQPSAALRMPMGIPYAAIPIAAFVMILNTLFYILFPKDR
jgi:TRAP-type C4-dicarboxylate transport system permease small subunit